MSDAAGVAAACGMPHRYSQSHSKPLKPDGGIYFLMIFLPPTFRSVAVHFPAGKRSLYSVYFLICVLVKSFSI